MNAIIKLRAEKLLASTRKAPKMFAWTRESFCNRIVTILEMCDFNINAIKFFETHLKVKGNSFKDGSLEIEDSWAREVVDDALKLIREGSLLTFS